MPQTKRNGFEEYKTQHIPESIFFDLDDNSDKNTNLPHMLVDISQWEKIISKMNKDSNYFIKMYNKNEAKIGRKMGHITVITKDIEKTIIKINQLID